MNRSVHKDTCRIWDRGVCNCGPINAAPESRDAGGAAPSADSAARVLEAAKRLLEHADFKLGGALSADSKQHDIPSNAVSQVKARHLASLRDAVAAQTGGEAVAPEAKPEWPKGAFFTDGEGNFYDEQAEPLDHAFDPPAPPAPLPGKESLTLSPPGNYIQTVPDHCDRIIWRGRYWALPIKSIDTPVSPTLEAAPADYPPRLADEVERELALMIDRCPEPLRRLSDWLANKLDEDDWKTAERLLLGAVESVADRAQRSGVSADPLPLVEPTADKPRFQWTCANGCGNCEVKRIEFEYERTETLEGELVGSKTRPQLVSKCCGAELTMWDNEQDEEVDVSITEPAPLNWSQHQVKKGEPS